MSTYLQAAHVCSLLNTFLFCLDLKNMDTNAHNLDSSPSNSPPNNKGFTTERVDTTIKMTKVTVFYPDNH